nr:hypothetical protein [Pandoravirus aubagnensis]
MTQPASSSSSSSNANSGAAPRHAATPAPRSAPQGEIFDALSTTLPPAPVARNGPAPSSSGAPTPPSPCPPPSATATPSGEAHETPSEQVARAPRSKGRRANSDDAPAAPATRKMPLSKGMLIVAGVALLLALFIGTLVIKRGLLAGLRQRRAAKKKAESLDPDDDDDDSDDGAKSARGGKGKVGGVLGGLFGGKDKSESTDVAKSVRSAGHGSASDPRQSRAAGSVPPMDPYQARAVRTASASRSPLPSTPSYAGQPPTVGPHGPAPPPQQQQQQQLHQQPPAHPAYQQQQPQMAPPQQSQMAPPPAQQQQAHRQASPRMALGHAPHQQHPPYAPHVQARLDGVPHPNMPPPTPQAGRLSPGGGRA